MNKSSHQVSSGRSFGVMLAVFAITGLAASAISSAAEDKYANVPSVVVDYSDLNLTTDQGAQQLYARLATAARHVCPEDANLTQRVAGVARHCVSAAVARAVSAVNSPRLAALTADARRPKRG
ncbi:MAG TPA: UrcA family protein [Steroidobacteraceae bacterium]|jgi:UrcA family protein|nr:UrcA family protein [Steroidobacteraceae bacterium]